MYKYFGTKLYKYVINDDKKCIINLGLHSPSNLFKEENIKLDGIIMEICVREESS